MPNNGRKSMSSNRHLQARQYVSNQTQLFLRACVDRQSPVKYEEVLSRMIRYSVTDLCYPTPTYYVVPANHLNVTANQFCELVSLRKLYHIFDVL
ncbi:hypothetical protein CEXT_572551 [Caerostris extrusa]|uniref:Uncharacterized protein n=1 Tax=Caerostris extrusa TaxID=172846 RepID=A0AAV4VFM5_CAEEX|nr:hypothetical protein CEXT_572551 [Caerostris extrusa]